MRKKVLFVITKSNFGGAQRYVYDLATTLPTEAFESVVAFGGTGERGAGAGTLSDMLAHARVRARFIRHFARDIFILKDIGAFFELMQLFREEKPDVVHLNSSKAGGIGACAARLTGVPRIVYTVHGWAYNEPVAPLTKLFRWVASLFTVLLAHDTITVSHFDTLHAPLHYKTVTIHNGIDAPTYLSRGEARQHIAAHADIPDDAFIVGTLAELHPNKGLDNLVHAATRFTNGHFVVFGEGEQREHLEAMIARYALQDRIHLVGFVAGARNLLPGFDVFALPSQKEGLPYTILEAGYAGLPVLATSVGGIPEIIDDQISGELVHVNDCAGLARDLQKLYDNPNTRARYGETLKEKVSRYFNLRGMVKQTIAVYDGYAPTTS